MTGKHHHTQLFSIDMRSCKLLFCPGWPEPMILPKSTSSVVWENSCALLPAIGWNRISQTFPQGWPPTVILDYRWELLVSVF
jgi:hypothetical protein